MALASIVVALALMAAAGGLWLHLRKSRRISQERLLSTASFDQSPQGAVLLDLVSLQVIVANAAFLRESGYSADELRGMPATRLFVDETSRYLMLSQLRERTD